MTGVLGILELWVLSDVLGLAFWALGIGACDFGLRFGLAGLELWRRRSKSTAQQLDLENRYRMLKGVRCFSCRLCYGGRCRKYWGAHMKVFVLIITRPLFEFYTRQHFVYEVLFGFSDDDIVAL